MTRKTLVLAATSAAFDIHPGQWFTKDTASSTSPSPVAPSSPTAPPSPPPVAPLAIAAGGAPNFRAIVQQAGPAVVGVTVAGQHRAGPGRGGGIPFRSQGSGFLISSDGLILRDGERIYVPVELG